MIFLRHPTPGAPAGLCYGRSEIGLGAEAPAEIARALETTPRLARVIASPAARCRRLAAALAERDGVEMVLDPRLRELDFGAWEGRRWWDIPRGESDPWAADPWTMAPPGGEAFAALHARVAAALREAGPDAALVTHAGPIRAARMILTGASFAAVFAEPVPYATPLRLERERA